MKQSPSPLPSPAFESNRKLQTSKLESSRRRLDSRGLLLLERSSPIWELADDSQSVAPVVQEKTIASPPSQLAYNSSFRERLKEAQQNTQMSPSSASKWNGGPTHDGILATWLPLNSRCSWSLETCVSGRGKG